MDFYSEELTLDIKHAEQDENQAASKESVVNLDNKVEKQSKNLIISQGKDLEINTSGGESQVLTQQCIRTEESGSEKVGFSETEIVSNSQVLEDINSHINPEFGEETHENNSIKEGDTKQIEDTSEPVQRRRRGRRTKKELYELKPTRGSTRKRKSPLILDYDKDSMKMRCSWTLEERQKLLSGLQELGIDNIKGVQAYVQSKTVPAVYNQIRLLRHMGQQNLECKILTRKKGQHDSLLECIARLNDWHKHFEEIDKMSPQRLFALSNVFLVISEYGKFPTPSECNGIDFRAMYRYLHCMLNGKPYYGVNQKTADVLLQCVTMFLRYLSGKLLPMVLASHLSTNSPIKYSKTYSRRGKMRFPSVSEKPDAFLDLLDLNPLNLPKYLLTKERYNEDDESDGDIDDLPPYYDTNDDEDSSDNEDDCD